MDVHHAPRPGGDEFLRQHAQEAGERDQADPVGGEMGAQGRLEAGAVAAEGAALDHGGGDAGLARAVQPGGVGAVGQDEGDPRRIGGVPRGGDQGPEVAAPPGDEDRDPPPLGPPSFGPP